MTPTRPACSARLLVTPTGQLAYRTDANELLPTLGLLTAPRPLLGGLPWLDYSHPIAAAPMPYRDQYAERSDAARPLTAWQALGKLWRFLFKPY
jgi:hypothetical protein